MTKIKLCGLTRPEDILAANELQPDFIGFVFASKSKRYISPEKAAELKAMLHPGIKAVGVFVNAPMETVESLLRMGIIDAAQLHGNEEETFIAELQRRTGKTVIRAFRIGAETDVQKANSSCADAVLLDAGAGCGTTFDWSLIAHIHRPYLLAGGLGCENVAAAIRALHPYGVDVSSGIETDGRKDKAKMVAFAAEVRKEERT